MIYACVVCIILSAGSGVRYFEIEKELDEKILPGVTNRKKRPKNERNIANKDDIKSNIIDKLDDIHTDCDDKYVENESKIENENENEKNIENENKNKNENEKLNRFYILLKSFYSLNLFFLMIMGGLTTFTLKTMADWTGLFLIENCNISSVVATELMLWNEIGIYV
jgi:hypothetical protein